MDFGNTLVDYPLMDWGSQISFTEKFLTHYIDTLPVQHQDSPSELAIRLNTEKLDGSVWRFRKRVRSASFFGRALPSEDAKTFERAICQAVFDVAVKFDDSLQCVAEFKRMGYRTGIVSNLPWGTSSDIWKLEFRRHGFDSNLIDQVVCCVDVGYRKPHPAPLRECVSRLSCAPPEVVFVGDGIVSDMQAAASAGCIPILLDRKNVHRDYSGTRITTLNELLGKLRNRRSQRLPFPKPIHRNR
jgi:FMN phosphatase YigB (HAD superfamily)